MKPTFIYGLVDPRTNELRYVGKTSNKPARRLKAHIGRTNLTPRRHSSRWVKGLVNLGLSPEMFVIEEVAPGGDWQEAERFWIAYYRFIGADLVNLTDGGEGLSGYKFTDERKDYLSKMFSGRTFDVEWRRKISVAKKGKNLGNKITLETKVKMAASKKVNAIQRWTSKTHCDNGHALSGDNLLPGNGISKKCRKCRAERKMEYYLRTRPPLKGRKPIKPKTPLPGYARGERHPGSKLTWAAVDEIRRRCSNGETRKSLADSFGVALTSIDQIIQARVWKPENRPQEMVA